MFNEGNMYEEIEESRNRKKRHQIALIKRITAIVLLCIFVIYFIILFIDMKRFTNGDRPLITTRIDIKEYDDGIVKTYHSIGWLFRYYNRDTIKENEMVPFYKGIKMDNITKRSNDLNLPERNKDYTIPENPMKQEKIDNVLFFYDGDNLLGTYACLNDNKDCEISISDILSEDTNNKYIKMNIIDNRYVFISEYKDKNTEIEEKKVYLYDITKESYIAEYEGIKYTKKDGEIGLIDSSKYIAKKNGYWGIDQVINGQVSSFENYKYLYINYDEDANLYIFKNNDDKWIIFNSNDKSYKEFDVKINNIYKIKNKLYLLNYEEINNKKNCKLYDEEGSIILEKEGIDRLIPYENYVIYIIDNKLNVIDYNNITLVENIELYIGQYGETSKIKQFQVNEINDMVVIKVPKSTESTHYIDEYYYNKNTWELVNKRTPQETISY